MLREEHDVTKVMLLWRAGPDGEKHRAPFLKGTAQVMMVGPGSPPPQASRQCHRSLTVKTETETPPPGDFSDPSASKERTSTTKLPASLGWLVPQK